MQNSRLIKKYKNRRLYDTELSEYITVEDLQRYVINHLPFHVIDVSNDKDITNATLLQIFVEMEGGNSQFLSAEMLRQMIILAHHPMNQAIKPMMEEAMRSLQNYVEANPLLTQMQQMNETWMEQWRNLFKK